MGYLTYRRGRIFVLCWLLLLAIGMPFLWQLSGPVLLLPYFFTLSLPLGIGFCIRKGIAKCLNQLDRKWMRALGICIGVAYLACQCGLGIHRYQNGDQWQWLRASVALFPLICFFLLHKRITPILGFSATILAPWHWLSGLILSLCLACCVIPSRYPLSLDEMLTKPDLTEDEEKDGLYVFVKTATNKQKIIPALESYIGQRKEKFWGYHYLLFSSLRIEGKDAFQARVKEAETVLQMKEMDIMLPPPTFRKYYSY